MERCTAAAITFLLISSSLTHSFAFDQFEDWTQNLLHSRITKQQVTHLHFYFHDTQSGKNPSAVRVAQAAGSDRSPTRFGVLMMADDPLTEGPEPTSKLVGRAQGLYGSAGQKEVGLIMALDYRFTDGNYSGSSFNILGLNPALNPVREMAVAGGTGLFRLARGVALAKTFWLNVTSGDAIVEYNVTLVH